MTRSSSAALFQVASADRPDAARRKKTSSGAGPPASRPGCSADRPSALRRRKAASRGEALGRSAGCIVSQCWSTLCATRLRPCVSPASPSSLASARATMTSRRRSRPWLRSSSALSSTAGQSTGMVDCDRLVVTLLDDLDLGFGEALDLVKRRIVAQISPRRIFTVQRIKPECEINHTQPPASGPETVRDQTFITLRHFITIQQLLKN